MNYIFHVYVLKVENILELRARQESEVVLYNVWQKIAHVCLK